MKDKIIEILNSETFDVTNEDGITDTVVSKDDFNNIAERIMKLFPIQESE